MKAPADETAGHRRRRLHRLDRRHQLLERRPRGGGARQPRATATGRRSRRRRARGRATCSTARRSSDVARRGLRRRAALRRAALVGESVSHPERYYRTNVGGTLNLLEAMRPPGAAAGVLLDLRGLRRSPTRCRSPRPRRRGRPTPTAPRSSAVDWMIGDFCLAHGLGAVSLRYFNVAGASGGLGEDHDPETHLIPNILQGRARGQRRASRSSAPTTRRRTAPRSATTSTSTTSPRRTCSRSTARARASTGSSTSATAAASRCAR